MNDIDDETIMVRPCIAIGTIIISKSYAGCKSFVNEQLFKKHFYMKHDIAFFFFVFFSLDEAYDLEI